MFNPKNNKYIISLNDIMAGKNIKSHINSTKQLTRISEWGHTLIFVYNIKGYLTNVQYVL